MKREQAIEFIEIESKTALEFNIHKSECLSLVTQIFDDFEKERICKTCRHCNESSGTQSDGMGWQTIECGYWDGNFSIMEVYDDNFGCNKWSKR